MAVTLTVNELGYAIRLVADTTETIEAPILGVLTDLLATSTQLVTDYAPMAPDSIHNEAARRLAGFLYDAPPSGSGGRWSNPMAQSGAQALLSSYRVRRATALGSWQPWA